MYSEKEIKEQIKLLNEEWQVLTGPVREKINILYVDDEPANLRSFKSVFRREFNIKIAESAVEAKEILQEHTFHIIITDQIMPHTTGIEFL